MSNCKLTLLLILKGWEVDLLSALQAKQFYAGTPAHDVVVDFINDKKYQCNNPLWSVVNYI